MDKSTILKNISKKFVPPSSTFPNKIKQIDGLSDHIPKKYYKIYFSKDIKKKHKVFDDGIMIISQSNLILYNSECSKIYEGAKLKNIDELITNEEPIQLGYSYYVEIDKEISEKEFQSGQVFMVAPILPSQKIIKKSISKYQDNRKTKMNEISIPDECFVLISKENDSKLFSCYIEKFLGDVMRPHQKEGVKFMLECVCGIRGANINGCILADSMGLGKTLQSITLIWTLLRQNPFSIENPFLKKVIIVTPVSLIRNWEREINKWLGNSRLIPLTAIGKGEDVQKTINQFTESNYRCLIISYESFRTYLSKIKEKCDLLIFDEGHRLKNMNIKTFQSFNSIECKRRIILTGTPLQNSLDEFYACVSFVNPALLPNINTFRKVFSNPIMESFKKNANEELIKIAQFYLYKSLILYIFRERSKELTKIIANIILRRQPDILKKLLPPKHEYMIFLKISEVQTHIYQNAIKKKNLFDLNINENSNDILAFILTMRKILNHPYLLYKDDSEISQVFRELMVQKNTDFKWEISYKFKFLYDLLIKIRSMDDKSEKIIIVSYFTQTLDLIEELCKELGFKLVRLDGKVQPLKRQSMVDKFNNPCSGIQIFLLCAKAGGTGLNLIGTNRMVMMEVDWNPSNDLQVMGRIWRDGQKKTVYIYRLISCGTLEEKILQRQLMKENLSNNIVDDKLSSFCVDHEDMKKLFEYNCHFKCQSFSEEENELTEFLQTNTEFTEDMTSYISFVKERKETVKFDKIEDKLTNENLFCKENAFLSQKNEEKPDEEDENYLKIDENEEEKFDYSELSEEDKNQNEDLVNEITNKEKKNLDIDSKITKSQIIDIEKYKENLNPDSTINSKKRKFSEPTDSHIINIIKKIK